MFLAGSCVPADRQREGGPSTTTTATVLLTRLVLCLSRDRKHERTDVIGVRMCLSVSAYEGRTKQTTVRRRGSRGVERGRGKGGESGAGERRRGRERRRVGMSCTSPLESRRVPVGRYDDTVREQQQPVHPSSLTWALDKVRCRGGG